MQDFYYSSGITTFTEVKALSTSTTEYLKK